MPVSKPKPPRETRSGQTVTTRAGHDARAARSPFTTDRIYEGVLDAYRAGARVPPPYRPKPDDPSVFFDGMPLKDEIRVSASAKYHASALKRAREGELERAYQLLRVSKAYLAPDELTRESYCIGLQLYYGVESYVYYRDHAFEAAHASMCRSLQAMNELQEAFGYGHIDGQRVHLAKNLLRVDARGGDALNAADAGFHLLLYVMGIDDAWPYPKLKSGAPDRSMTDQVRHMMFNQVARELVLLFIHADQAVWAPIVGRGEEILSRFRSPANDEIYASSRIRTTRAWLQLKQLLLEEDVSTFLVRAGDCLRAGPRVPALWYGVVRDVVQVCERAASHRAQHVARGLLEDVGPRHALDQVTFGAIFEQA